MHWIALGASIAFAVFEKDIGRAMIQRWKPANSIEFYHWPTVNTWVRARIALEQPRDTFVVLHADDKSDMRAYVCSKHARVHLVDACIWTPLDQYATKCEALSELNMWHENTFPDTIITSSGMMSEDDKHAWNGRRQL